jgi:pimeloyl-ACP methyl ester carboxylesterase
MRYVRAYPTQLPDLAGLLPTIQTPVLIIAGRRDHVVPLVNAEFLLEWLLASKLAVLEAGHFTWRMLPTSMRRSSRTGGVEATRLPGTNQAT